MRLLLQLLQLVGMYMVSQSWHWRHRKQELPKCGFEGCPAIRPGYINVHIICHSHNDAGWLDTVDVLYSSAVHQIYSNVVSSLAKYPERRYVSAENIFFSRWWFEQQHFTIRAKVKELVDQGRLQFVGGGWTQNDEANTHYTAIVDQMTLGLRFLNDTFGNCGRTRVGWQLDPFGHSRAFASLLAQMGFECLFLGRVHYGVRQRRIESKGMEFVWKTSTHLGQSYDLFTVILYDNYIPPVTFRVNDFYPPPYDNMLYMAGMADDILEDVLRQSMAYATNNIIIMVGGDLAFQNAPNWFNQIDATILAVNTMARKKGRRVQMFYSTPVCYLGAVHAANRSWPVFREDLFPYADTSYRVWTGYFSSRPNLKGFARYANGFLQVCKQLAVLGGKEDRRIRKLQEALATLQHHDAITGTSKQHVANDYARMLSDGIAECEPTITDAITVLMNPKETSEIRAWSFCHTLNMSQCSVSENTKPAPSGRDEDNTFSLLIYNPMSYVTNTYLRLPIPHHSFTVKDHQDQDVDIQVTPLIMSVQNIPERTSFAKTELVFPAQLPALGYTTFQVTGHAKKDVLGDMAFLQLESEHRFIENERYRLEVDTTSGLLTHITLLGPEKGLKFKQSFFSYTAQKQTFNMLSGGAYSFNPDSNVPLDLGGHVTYRVVQGPHVQEIHQIFDHWLSQVVRLYRKSNLIEFQWIVGPLPDHQSNDVVTRYETSLDNAGVFFTDSNGMQTMKRSLNKSGGVENVASTFYPIVSWIFLRGPAGNFQMTVFPDRAQGGSSCGHGSLELMLHRRYMIDDDLGVAEALNELGVNGEGIVVKGRHLVYLGTPQETEQLLRRTALEQVYQPILLFSHTPLPPTTRKQHSALRVPMPPGVHLMTLEGMAENQVLLRLEHILPQGIFNISVTHLLNSHLLLNAEETVLSGDIHRREFVQRDWPQGVHSPRSMRSTATMLEEGLFQMRSNVLVSLKPGQIRTFLATLQPFAITGAHLANHSLKA